MLRPLRGTLSPLGRATAVASSWWLSGGISAANCVGAYQAKGAASYAASKVNLANPGAYTLADPAPPSWDAASGWTSTGSARLRTGIVPASGYSIIVRFSGAVAGALVSAASFAPLYFECYLSSSARSYAAGAATRTAVAGGITAGVMAVAGPKGYLDGVEEVALPYTGAPSTDFGIFFEHFGGGGGYDPFAGNIQAVAIYNATLTAGQVAAVTTAMNAL